MEYKGFPLVGNTAIVNLVPPSTVATGSSNIASDVVSLAKYDLMNVVIQFSTHADADLLTVYKSSDLTTNSTQPIAFNYCYTTQSATNAFTTQYVATSSGIVTGTVDNQMYAFSINREALSSQYPNVYFTLTDSTGHSVSALGVLTGARYVRQPMPDALS
jgi:hypothetical protein